MAKTLNTTKDKLKLLLSFSDKIPSSKLASDLAKHMGFRKTVKPHLKKYLDDLAAIKDKVAEKQREDRPKFEKLQKEIEALTSKKELTEDEEAKKKEAEAKRDKLNADFMGYINTENAIMDKASEDLKLQKVEVVFEDEDFLAEKNMLTDNATTLFNFKTPQGEDRFDADSYEEIMDIFDNVK